jgi:hypothetical protein
MIPTVLRLTHDLAGVVAFSCFKFVFHSMDCRCGIKVLFFYSLNQKSVTLAFDRPAGQGLTLMVSRALSNFRFIESIFPRLALGCCVTLLLIGGLLNIRSR